MEGPKELDVLVVGAGRFGSQALREMLRRQPPPSLAAVDLDRRALEPWRERGVTVHVGEAVEVLDRILQAAPPRWVVPAVPLHLAYSWVFRRLSQTCRVQRIPVPENLGVPNPLSGPDGDLYSSFADFVCPQDCSEPHGRCSATGEKRAVPLFRLLDGLSVPGFGVLGLRSHQLAPGVGGYRSVALWDLLHAATKASGQLILFTACRCHGVLSGLRMSCGH